MQRLRGLKIVSWNLGKMSVSHLKAALEWLTLKLRRADYIVCFQEVELWPVDPIAEGWGIKHSADSYVAIGWPAAVASSVTSESPVR